MAQFEKVDPRVRFPALEEEVLGLWRERETFRRSVEERPEDRTFVFYEGPPTRGLDVTKAGRVRPLRRERFARAGHDREVRATGPGKRGGTARALDEAPVPAVGVVGSVRGAGVFS